MTTQILSKNSRNNNSKHPQTKSDVTGHSAFDEPSIEPRCNDNVDLREQLFNTGDTGPITQVQLPAARITSLRGVMLDIDPSFIREGQLVPTVPDNPKDFYDIVVKPWIERHPTLAKAEVRNSGTGLHVILRLDEPVDFLTDADRDRWAAIVQIVQSALPSDPRAPGITAVTRAIGSTNSKNDAVVSQLRPGEGISADELVALTDELTKQPFRTLMKILTGGEQTVPCIKCKAAESSLKSLDYCGSCYSGCNKVRFEDLVAEVVQ